MLCIRRPLCWMAVFCAFGLIGAQEVSPMLCAAGLIICTVGALIWMRKGRRAAFVMLALAFCAAGALRMQVEQRVAYTGNEEPVAMTARIIACDAIDEESGYASLIVDRVETADGRKLAPGRRIRLYVRVEEDVTIPVGGTITAQEVALSALRVRRNPGGFDQEGYYRSRGVVMTASAGEAWTIEPPKGLSLIALRHAAQTAVRERMDRLFTYAAPLFDGLLLGVKDGIDETVYADLRISGLAHLLSVSGLHVSAVLGLALFVLNKRQTSLRCSTAILLVVLWSFAWITNLSPGVLRACLTGSLLVISRALHERYDAPSGLAAAFLLMTVSNPWYVRDTGFVLSFATVSGMLLVHPTLSHVLESKCRLRSRLAQTVSISLSAHLACLPFQVMFFGEISLIGPFLNLLCVPLATMLVVGGMLLLLLSVVLLPVAAFFAPVLRVGATALQGIAQAASNISYTTLRMAVPSAVMIAAYYALLLGISPLLRGRRKMLCLGLAAAVLTIGAVREYTEPPKARYVTLDVGQGDSAVVQSREGTVCVIDAGPLGNTELTGYLHHEGLAIDLLMLSHLDSDHAGGLDALAHARIPVRRIVVPYGIDSQETDAAVLSALVVLEKRGSEICAAGVDDVFSLPGMEIDVLGPSSDARSSNARSLVTRIKVEGVTMLFMGDAPHEVEPLRDAACDLVKIAHHGSKSGTSDLLLDFAKPETAIISVGRNAFGHPSAEVLARLDQRGIDILRTDACGMIEITLENGTYRIETMLGTGE